MSRQPQTSGRALIRLLNSLGYETVRQRGSHVRMRKITPIGEHNITIPDHKTLAKGTLNDVLAQVSQWNGISKDELLDRLR